MDKDTYEKRAAGRQKQKDAVSVASSDVNGLSLSEIVHRREDLTRRNAEQLEDFKATFDVPTSPKDGTSNSREDPSKKSS